MYIKKNFKKILKIPIYFLSPIIILLIILLYPIINLRFSLQSSERIGEISTRMEVYLSRKKFFKNGKFLDIFILTDVISNKTYIELLKQKIFFIPNFISFPIYKILNLLSYKFPFFKRFILHTSYQDKDFTIFRTQPNLIPNENFIKKGDNFLKELGIPKDAKILCLIVRDQEYLKKKFPNKDYSYHNFRNCNIQNFEEAIKIAIDNGYYVFRMGEVVESNLKINDNKFIDYSSHYRTDFLDIYLAYKCKFVITTSTGWDNVPAFTFRKPVVWTNMAPIGDLLIYSPNFLFSFKLYFDTKKNRVLNLEEISKTTLSYDFNANHYKDENIELLENKPDEIKELVLEMINRLNNNIKYSASDEKIQIKFWKKYVSLFDLKNIKNHTNTNLNPLICTSQRLFNGKIISRIGNSFLNKYKDLLI